MENSGNKNEIWEMYKIHAELADRVSDRRDALNRQYLALNSALLIFTGLMIKFPPDNLVLGGILLGIGTIGGVLSVYWEFSIFSYYAFYVSKLYTLITMESVLFNGGGINSGIGFAYYAKESSYDSTFKVHTHGKMLAMAFSIIFACIFSGGMGLLAIDMFKFNDYDTKTSILLIILFDLVITGCIYYDSHKRWKEFNETKEKRTENNAG